MSVASGSTTAGVTIPIGNVDQVVHIINIMNTSANTLTMNLKIQKAGSTQVVHIAPLDMQIEQGTGYVDRGYQVKQNESIILEITGGSADYYFYYDSGI